MRKFLLTMSVMLLTGCVADPNNHTLIVLHNPKTGETVQCKANALATWNVYAEVETCAEGYEKSGFKRMSAY